MAALAAAMGLGLLLQRRHYAAVWSPYRLDPYDTSGNGSTVMKGGVYGTPYGKAQPAERYGHQASGTQGDAGALYDSGSTGGETQVWAPGSGEKSAEFPGTQQAAHGTPAGIAAGHGSGASPVPPAPAGAVDLPPAPAPATVFAAATAMAQSCVARFHGMTTAPVMPYPPPPPQPAPSLSAAAPSAVVPPAASHRSTAALLATDTEEGGSGPALGTERGNAASVTQGRGNGAAGGGGGAASGGRRALSFADSLALPPVGFDQLTGSASGSGDGGSSGEESSASGSEQDKDRVDDGGEGGVPEGGGDLEAGGQGGAGAAVGDAAGVDAAAVWRRHTSGGAAAAAAVPGGDGSGARRSLTLVTPLAARAARGVHTAALGLPEPASLHVLPIKSAAAASSPLPHVPSGGRSRRELHRSLRHSSSSKEQQQHRHHLASLSKGQQHLLRLEFTHVTVTVPWSARHQQRHPPHHHPHDEVPPALLQVQPEHFPAASTVASSPAQQPAGEVALPHAQSITPAGTSYTGISPLLSPQPARHTSSVDESEGSRRAAGSWWKCGGCLGLPWGSGSGQQEGRERRPRRAILNHVSGRCLRLLVLAHTRPSAGRTRPRNASLDKIQSLTCMVLCAFVRGIL